MPYRRRTPAPRRRSAPVHRRPAPYRRRSMVPRRRKPGIYVNPVGTADYAFVKLRYVDTFSVGANGVAPSLNVFRGNGPYDPLYAAGGGTCDHFATYAALYQRYICTGSKLRVTFMNGGANDIMCAVIAAPDTYTPGSEPLTETMEQKRCITRTLGNNNGGNNIKVIQSYQSTARIMSVPKVTVLADDAFQSGVATIPSREWVWNILTQTADEATNTTVRFKVEITYYCKFFQNIYS